MAFRHWFSAFRKPFIGGIVIIGMAFGIGKDKGSLEKVAFGIDGFDKALNGGIPKGNIVLLSGGCGTGKSTFCLQWLVNGATKFKEKGLYISTEQNKEELAKAASQYGWDLADLEKKNLLKIAYFDVVEGDGFLDKIYDLGSQFQPARIVVDSLTTFTDSILVSDENDKKPYTMAKIASTVSPMPKSERVIAKTALYHLLKKLKLFKSTVIIANLVPKRDIDVHAYKLGKLIFKGVIILEYLPVGKSVFRNMRIRKMRYTDHEKGSLSYEITKDGITLKPREETL